MFLAVLDFTSSRVVIHKIDHEMSINIDRIEDFLSKRYNLDNISWMMADDVVSEDNTSKAKVFRAIASGTMGKVCGENNADI